MDWLEERELEWENDKQYARVHPSEKKLAVCTLMA